MNYTLAIPNSLRKSAALLAIVSLLATSLPIGVLTAQAARTGVDVAVHATNSAPLNTNIALIATATNDVDGPNESATIELTDGGQGGVFSDGTLGGVCGASLGTGPQTLTVNSGTSNKGFCYQNSIEGDYTISVQLATSTGNVGAPATIGVTVTAPIAPQVVTATNFNTHSGADYEGINVGFTINDQFGTVSAVKVELFKGGDLIVENNHNQALLDLINGGEESLSTPFIINDGTYVETYWNLGSHAWTSDDVPTKAVISVTDETGTYIAENTNLAEPNGWLLADMLPQPLDPFPSTNDENRTNNHPHVNFVSDAAGSITLEFRNDTNSQAFFEVRTDGIVADPSRPLHYNPCKIGADPLHPSCDGLRYLSAEERYYAGGVSVDNRSSQASPTSTVVRTFSATESIEIRLALGGERDWDFDWVYFSVPEPKDEVVSTVVVHPYDLQGWIVEETGGGQTDFVKDLADSPLGDGYLKLTTDAQDTARAGVSKPVDELLMDLSGLSYSTRQNAANVAEGNAAYRIRFDADGDLSTTNDVATLVYEPYWQNNENPDPAPVIPDVWQEWDVDQGTFWVSVPGGSAAFFTPDGVTNGAGGPPFFTIDEMVALYPDARVTSFGVGIGSYNPSYDIDVDEIVFGVETDTDIIKTIYDFEPAPTATVTLCKFDQFDEELSGWQLALVGDNVGTYQVPSDGSVITTGVLASGDYVVKSTGTYVYRSPAYEADARFSERAPTDAGYEDLEYKPWRVVNIGGMHINDDNTLWGDVFSPDHNYYAPLTLASADSVDLKIGDDSYGDNSGALTAAVHNGFTGVTDETGCVTFEDVTYGTYQVEELLQTGWVNESGLGELVVDEEEVDHEIVNFDTTIAPEMPEHLSPEDEAIQNFNDFYFDWTDVDGAVEYEFQSSQNPAVDGDGVLTTGVWNNKTGGAPDRDFLTESEIHSYGANGTWYWQVRAIDTYGNMSDWTEPWMLTIDMVAPSAPQITHPVDEQVFDTTPILNEWTVATDNNGIDYYQIAYRYDDAHTFGGTTCPDVTIDGDWVGCRDVDGTSRNHSPALSEQGGVTIWVRAFDNAGNASGWSDPVHYYYDEDGSGPMDNAPAVPTGLGWNDSNSDPVADGGTTELVSGTALWDANTEPDFNHYIYKYWNNISTSAYNSTSSAWTVNNGTSNSRSGSFTEGEGTHYFCIVAVDNAGHESECSEEFTIIYDTDSEEPTTGSSTQTITGNTAVGENQPGWLFNRDTGTQSPFAFVLGTSTIGTGSLFINPITNTINGNNDKFIAELFLLSPIAELDSLSYDFNIAAVDATDENEFYMSVYANFGSSSGTNYYDCRYSVVPTVGVVDGWTTVTFNPASTYPVAKWSGSTSTHACPTSPDAMNTLDPGSSIRAIALNVGDTSANDLGVSGYFDNVVVVQTTGLHTETTTYDFEPTTTPVAVVTTNDGNDGGGGGSRRANARVLGATTDTDNELYDLLEQIKNRLAQLLLASYVSEQGQTSPQSGSGAVLGDSIAQADLELAQEAEDVEAQEENEIVEMAVNEEDEESEQAMAISWQNYYWILVLLWLLSTAGALWRRNEYSETVAMRAVQGTFIAIALLLLAGSVLFGLAGAFWPSLIVTIGAISAYFWSIE